MKTIAILALMASSLAAADSKPSTILVRVVPEVLVSVQGTASVAVRIRLSETATAQLWIGDECSMLPAATKTIEQTGTYSIQISLLPGNGGKVCLSSVEDGFMEAVPLLVPRVAESVHCTNSTCYSI